MLHSQCKKVRMRALARNHLRRRLPESPGIFQKRTENGFPIFHCRSGNSYNDIRRSEETLPLPHPAWLVFYSVYSLRLIIKPFSHGQREERWREYHLWTRVDSQLREVLFVKRKQWNAPPLSM